LPGSLEPPSARLEPEKLYEGCRWPYRSNSTAALCYLSDTMHKRYLS